MPDREKEKQATDLRRHPRLHVEDEFPATITDAAGNKTDAVVRDISAGGAGLIVGGAFHNEAFVDLHMEGFGRVSARVARKFVQGIGVEFNLSESERAEMKEELIKFRRAGGRQKH
jgi:hypothetical protein